MPLDATTYLPTPAVSEEAAIVRRIMELLAESENWCQGTRYRDDGAMCLMGAEEKARPVGHHLGAKVVNKAIHRECGRSIHLRNDTPGRTHAEIMAMLARVLRRFEGV